MVCDWVKTRVCLLDGMDSLGTKVRVFVACCGMCSVRLVAGVDCV